ncbi:MAG: hypothetical protein K8U03_21280 [Planctomycetia bacterium]|nr:hypothetical protein [Planctomycetia bacterium]
MSRHSIPFVLALFAAVAGSTAQAFGQAAPAAPAAAPAAGAAPAKPPAAKPAAAAPAAAPAEPAEPEKYADPAVQALMDTKPETPQDLVNVIALLLDLKQPKPAKTLFTKLLAAATEEADLAALGKKVGSAALYRLAEVPEFRPQGLEFVRKVTAAMDRAARNPDRLAELIERLKEPSLEVRLAAIAELRSGREQAALALLNVLLAPDRSAEHGGVRAALASLGADGIEPLALFAAAGNESQRTASLMALGLTDDREAREPLYAAAFAPQSASHVRQIASQALARRLGKLPSPITAAAELYLDAKRLYLSPIAPEDLTAPAGVWHWDVAAKKPVLAATTRRAAVLAQAARLARTAAEIADRDPSAVTLAQAASLEAALLTAPVAKPQPATEEAPAAEADPAAPKAAATPAAAASNPVMQWSVDVKPTAAELRRLLEFAAANDRVASVAAVVGLLANAEGVRSLDGVGGRPSPLAKLMTHPDRRIRFAALEAIVKLNPQEPFVGSSAVADALGYFAASTGLRKALAVDANIARARDLSGITSSLGFQSDTASTARDAVRMASADPDLELVVMYRPMLLAELGQLLAQYRADYRTARLPVVVYCEPQDVERTRSLIAGDPLAIAIYQPRSTEQFVMQTSDFAAAASASLVPAAERVQEARSALASMAGLLAKQNKVFNLRSFETALLAAAWSPAVSLEASRVLGYFGSPAGQRTLVDVASSESGSLEARKAASEAFRESVYRHGTLLTKSEIERQYARYNASATLDKETQAVLGSLLDAIEARAVKVPGIATAQPAVVTPPASPVKKAAPASP